MCTHKTISTIEFGESNEEKAENLSIKSSGSERSKLSACFSQWRKNFNPICLMVLVNKLTLSQQSASIAQFDSTLSVGLTLGLYIIGKLIGNIVFSRVAISFQIKTALLYSTGIAVIASVSNLTIISTREKLSSSNTEAVLQCIIQLLIGIGTGNKGAIVTYISAAVSKDDLSRANLRISCYENIGYTLGPLTVIILTFLPYPTLISSVAHIAIQMIIIATLLLMKTKSITPQNADNSNKSLGNKTLMKTVLRFLPLSMCACVFSLYVAVAVSVTKELFTWDDKTVIRYHAPTLLVPSLLSTLIAYSMKLAMKTNNFTHIPKSSGVFLVMLSMLTLVPAIVSISDKLSLQSTRNENSTLSDQASGDAEQTIYHGMSHLWLITAGLTLASFGTILCKVNNFTLTANKVSGHSGHMGVVAAVWWLTSGVVTLLYGLIADTHYTVVVFPSAITALFVVIFVMSYISGMLTKTSSVGSCNSYCCI